MGPSSYISIPSPFPTFNVSQYISMLDSSSPSFNLLKLGSSNAVKPLLKKHRKSYYKYRVFQHTWATKFPWAQLILGPTSQNFVTPKLQMKCIVCSTIEKKDNFFPPKLDTIQKHVGCPQAVVAIVMLLSMSGFITSMHPITKTRRFTQEKEIFTQILLIVKVHTLIKFVQHQNVFIVESMDVVQFTKAKLFKLYINPYSHFENMAFDVFKSLINHSNEQLPLKWKYDLAHLAKILGMKICEKIYDVHAFKLLMVLVIQFVKKM